MPSILLGTGKLFFLYMQAIVLSLPQKRASSEDSFCHLGFRNQFLLELVMKVCFLFFSFLSLFFSNGVIIFHFSSHSYFNCSGS